MTRTPEQIGTITTEQCQEKIARIKEIALTDPKEAHINFTYLTEMILVAAIMHDDNADELAKLSLELMKEERPKWLGYNMSPTAAGLAAEILRT